MGIDPNQLKDYVIRPTLSRLETFFPGASNPSALNLVLGTAGHESLCGQYLHQVGGPAMGIYQIEPETHNDLWEHFLTYQDEDAQRFVASLGGFHAEGVLDDDSIHAALMTNLAYATAICRLLYYRQSFDWPHHQDIPKLAEIWKQFYNTAYGKGTVDQYVADFPMAAI